MIIHVIISNNRCVLSYCLLYPIKFLWYNYIIFLLLLLLNKLVSVFSLITNRRLCCICFLV